LDVVAAGTGAGFLIIIIAIFALMWLFVIRPQKRRQVAQQELLQSVSEGDEILTAGGLYGTVRAVEGDEVTLEVAPGTNVRLAKRAVAAILTQDEEPEEPEEDEEPEEMAAAADPIERKPG
jgi:preprotein translocase subunit YajC